MKNADMPAMPLDFEHHNTRGKFINANYIGLTKRDMFAMHAMQAWINHHGSANNYSFSDIEVARSAVACADALLAELERTK